MQDNHIDLEQLPKIDHEQCGQEMAFDVRRLRNNDMTDPFRFFRYIQPAFIFSKKGNPGFESRPVWRLNTWHDLYAKPTYIHSSTKYVNTLAGVVDDIVEGKEKPLHSIRRVYTIYRNEKYCVMFNI